MYDEVIALRACHVRVAVFLFVLEIPDLPLLVFVFLVTGAFWCLALTVEHRLLFSSDQRPAPGPTHVMLLIL